MPNTHGLLGYLLIPNGGKPRLRQGTQAAVHSKGRICQTGFLEEEGKHLGTQMETSVPPSSEPAEPDPDVTDRSPEPVFGTSTTGQGNPTAQCWLCYPRGIISGPFHSPKCPGLKDTFYGSPGWGKKQQKLDWCSAQTGSSRLEGQGGALRANYFPSLGTNFSQAKSFSSLS